MKMFKWLFEIKEINKISWIDITDISQIDEISNSEEVVLIFKHSTICRKSRKVLKKFQKKFSEYNIDLKMYCLDLRKYEELSCELGVRFNVIHESPQVIIIRDGRAIVHKSQESINSIDVMKYV